MKAPAAPEVALIIPFRQREGGDLRRSANLDVVQGWWSGHGYEPQIVSDELGGDDQFNRHRAYNRAIEANPSADVFVFTEADMLIHPSQITSAVALAYKQPGLVVPFTEYRYLSEGVTNHIRETYYDMPATDLAAWWALPAKNENSVFQMRAESVIGNGDSIGAVNVVSRGTINRAGGFTEATRGNWYDDNIVEEGFAFLTGRKTRWVKGPAVHLYHLPGWSGEHLTEADKAATAHNKTLLRTMRRSIRSNDRTAVRRLMQTREEA